MSKDVVVRVFALIREFEAFSLSVLDRPAGQTF